MNNFPYINPDNFKKWMKSQNDFKLNLEQKIIGLTAETKFSGKRITEAVNLKSGKLHKVVKEFIDNGGTVQQVIDDEYLIEVNCGSFYINKKYVIV